MIAGCDRRADIGPVVASVIGTAPQLRDASRGETPESDRLLADSVAQGLVRFDATGQIEPGVAERWIVTDEGRTYIFRLREARWSDGRPVTAPEVVAILKRQIAPASHNPLKPYLTAIESIVAMTPQIIQIELSYPRPDLLKIFAQPELAIMRLRGPATSGPAGSGPFRIAHQNPRSLLLTPVRALDRSPDEEREKVPEDDVRLIGETAARAITRFAAHRSDLVTGGTVRDWPLLQLASLPPANVRLDPAGGLFGLAIVKRTGFLEEQANRSALAGVIDRAALTAAFSADWASTEQLLPDQLDSAAAPASSPWVAQDHDNRQLQAATRIAIWQRNHPGPLRLRIALPSGPGGNLLWGRIGADLIAIGIQPERAALDDRDADLRLVDAVAPYDSARWYLAAACAPCGGAADQALEAARVAPTLAARGDAIAAADAAIAADVPFIPIARPLRWSLVSLRLRQWQPNPRAWHPLNHLRAVPK
ncbi:ABC transporter substrate-binding protein [uncultured Sphingomonas sp.]|uniref:ABC transporter substrate-binding protein n=1 Tax=uncultured Sphingomonas sp. TaxID=158754 RepID=UPI002607797E|nr:ABC transporter substrate-binding protein [uncultured Sphingomonas sp.]